MKRIIQYFLLILLCSNAYAGDPVIEAKIEKLNAAAIELLGISLNALSYLVEASPYAYMPLSYLEKSGKIDYIKELEEAGYVQISKRIGLPDGQEQSETFINVRPLKTGEEIQRCIQALKHNKASQKDA
jgi:hypothetical protein